MNPKKVRKMSEKKDYFDYVTNVLGVKSILLNSEHSKPVQDIRLLICVDNFTNYVAEETELLAKMISALKIDLQLIKVVALNDCKNFQSEFAVYFLEDLNQNSADKPNTIRTYAPRFLLKNPKYKKNAWNDLQKVIAYFNNYPSSASKHSN